jgi:class 3 adenylate cyclase
MERRLAAIMAADVVGYWRLIRSDEDSTLAALKSLRSDLIGPKIAEHRGVLSSSWVSAWQSSRGRTSQDY